MPTINGKYYTDEEIQAIKDKVSDDEFEEFLTSGMIGALTGSAILGGILGGSYLGGILGDGLFGDDNPFF